MRPEDQSLTRDLSKPSNFYIEYIASSGKLCCCSTHRVKVMKSGSSLFSGSFTGLRGKDGIRNQFDLVLKFALHSLSPKRHRGPAAPCLPASM